MVIAAWTFAIALLAATASLCRDADPVVRMLALVLATFLGMKVVVYRAARADGAPRLPPARWACYLVWFGMNPRAFARRSAHPRDGVRRLAGRGLRNALLGAAAIFAARSLATTWATPLLMVGLSLVVHFGLFTLLAALLRARGFAVPLLFDAPWRARSAAEFWAVRWNRGFAEMTAIAVQRPLARRMGRDRALLVSFLVSGLLHEVAISAPVDAGYGLPTAYFVLQGLVQRRQADRPSRLSTLVAIALPLPLVFHPWFVAGVVVPLLGA